MRTLRVLTLVVIVGLFAAPVLAQNKRNHVSGGWPYQIVPHVVDGGAWRTTLVIVNLNFLSDDFELEFFSDAGNPKEFEIVGRGRVTVVRGRVPGRGTITLNTVGRAADALQQGWARLGTRSGIDLGILAVFGTRNIPGRPDFEATVPASRSFEYDSSLPFDNTEGFVSSMAILNATNSSSLVFARVYDENGEIMTREAISLSARNKIAFATTDRWPETRNKRGLIYFSDVSDSVSALGFRFNPGGAFTTMPLLEK